MLLLRLTGSLSCRICKAKEHLAHVPIIIVTAEVGEEVVRESYAAGATCFVSKPAKSEELHQLLKTLTSNKHTY